jgi:hypothetical protein
MRQDLAAAANRREQLHVEVGDPVLVGQRLERARMRPARVVDECVETSERCGRARDEVADLLGVGDVGALRVDRDVVRAQLFGNGKHFFLATRADRDVRAFAYELLRDREPEALRASGDDRPATLEAELHLPIASRIPRRGGWKTSTWRHSLS